MRTNEQHREVKLMNANFRCIHLLRNEYHYDTSILYTNQSHSQALKAECRGSNLVWPRQWPFLCYVRCGHGTLTKRVSTSSSPMLAPACFAAHSVRNGTMTTSHTFSQVHSTDSQPRQTCGFTADTLPHALAALMETYRPDRRPLPHSASA